MKQTVNNTWNDGLNLDLHPMIAPDTVLTDCVNGTFITYNGNEYCLQNNRGNTYKATLTSGYTPIGMKEHNGILYIVSVNGYKTEIGTYPGLDWTIDYETENTLDVNKYSPLENVKGSWYIQINCWDGEELSGTDEQRAEQDLYEYFRSQIDRNLLITCDSKDDALKSSQWLDNNEWDYTLFTNDTYFRTTDFRFDVEHPVTIEIQDSYDGSVNLILTDGEHTPRIVNTCFSVLPHNKYKLIKPYYKSSNINSYTKLITYSTAFTSFKLTSVSINEKKGQLKGGTYTFYLKYADAAGNQTYSTFQSGPVAIYKYNTETKTPYGTLADERTDNTITFNIEDVDRSFDKFYLYYSREYSDTSGYSMSEVQMIAKPYDITGDNQEVTITGFEATTSVNEEDLNITYHNFNTVKTMTQQQDMLFVGNITKTTESSTLKELSRNINVTIKSQRFYRDWEFHDNVYAIYSELGYWAHEYYKLGIVYVYDNGYRSSVYDLGKDEGIVYIDKTPLYDSYYYFEVSIDSETQTSLKSLGIIGYFVVRQKRIPKKYCQAISIGVDKDLGIPLLDFENQYFTESIVGDDFAFVKYKPGSSKDKKVDLTNLIENNIYDVTMDGDVFPYKFSKWQNPTQVSTQNTDYLWFHEVSWEYYKCELSNNSYYIARGHNKLGLVVYIWNSSSKKWEISQYYGESNQYGNVQYWKNTFGKYNKEFDTLNPSGKKKLMTAIKFLNTSVQVKAEEDDNDIVKTSFLLNHIVVCKEKLNGLFSFDACLVPEIRNMLIGNEFLLTPARGWSNLDTFSNNKLCHEMYDLSGAENNITSDLTYVPSGENKYLEDGFNYTTIIGNVSSPDVKVIKSKHDGEDSLYSSDKEQSWRRPVRGLFMPFIASSATLTGQRLYNIERNIDLDALKKIVSKDESPYYCISDVTSITDTATCVRGDCYVCNSTVRYIRNFDNGASHSNIIIADTWYNTIYDENLGLKNINNINLDDLNNVPLGVWLSFSYLSSYNLNFRSKDTSDPVSTSYYGGESRSFVPLQKVSLLNNYKQEESWLQNDGYNKSLSRIRYNSTGDLLYQQNEFSNRIIFSNKNVQNEFRNGYRTFQSLDYRDYDKRYGEIVKLLPWDNNLFCVFEHGLSVIPVNEKALIQTSTEQSVHIYGEGVLPDQMTLISPDYGSQYPDSVIRTPIGIYGLDMSAKKIWRFSNRNGFETLSDMKIETLLNDNIISKDNRIELDNSRDVRTHYDSFKGDVIFTWNDDANGGNKQTSITFNERQNLWVTKNDWIPTLSENVNGAFYSVYDSKIYKHDVDSPLTQWYGEQKPFEIEFVVSNPVGVHKIIENLQIISNNCQPEQLTFEIIGDVYMFNKEKLRHLGLTGEPFWNTTTYVNSDILHKDEYNTPIISEDSNSDTKGDTDSNYFVNRGSMKVFNGDVFKETKNTSVIYYKDDRTQQYHLIIPQQCRNVETWGRRLGNIQYKEDSWYSTVEPLIYDSGLEQAYIQTSGKYKSTRIRDKWCKIRIRYSGEDLAVITAIKTTINI